jgi:hypothetical protein
VFLDPSGGQVSVLEYFRQEIGCLHIYCSNLRIGLKLDASPRSSKIKMGAYSVVTRGVSVFIKKARMQNRTERALPEVRKTHLRETRVESRAGDLKNLDESTNAPVEPGRLVSIRQISQAAEVLDS